MTTFHMVLSVNYMWIFIEALYLHMLIFVSVFSENSSIRWYIAFGWRKYMYNDCPLLFSWHVHIRYNCLTVYFGANRLRTIVRRTYTHTPLSVCTVETILHRCLLVSGTLI